MDANFCKTMFADVSRVLHHPETLTGANFDNCYNREAHVAQALGKQDPYSGKQVNDKGAPYNAVLSLHGLW